MRFAQHTRLRARPGKRDALADADCGAFALATGVPPGNLDEPTTLRSDYSMLLSEAVYDAVHGLESVAGLALKGRTHDSLPSLDVAQARIEGEHSRFAAMGYEALGLVQGGR